MALTELRNIPIPAFTLQQLEQRRELLRQSNQILRTCSNQKAFNKAAKKVRKFTDKFK
jgi:hypothetical protein